MKYSMLVFTKISIVASYLQNLTSTIFGKIEVEGGFKSKEYEIQIKRNSSNWCSYSP